MNGRTSFRFPSLCAVALALSATAGCDSRPLEVEAFSETRFGADPEGLPLTTPRGARAHELDMIALNDVIPEFAGYFLRPDGRVQVLLTDDQAEAAAKIAVAEVLSARRPDRFPDIEKVEVLVGAADYTFLELKEWRDRVSMQLWLDDQAGVVSVDLAEDRNRVVIGVLPESGHGTAEAAVGALGIPLEAVLIHEEGYAAPDRGASSHGTMNPALTQLLTHRFDTIVAGIRYRFKDDGVTYICTLGPLVTGGFLTASHCTDDSFSTDNGAVWQNSTIPADSIGFENLDPSEPLTPNSQCGTRCRWSDASLHTYTGSRVHGLALIARPTSSDPVQGPLTRDMDYLGIQVDGEFPNPILGETAQKVGQATGWTYGTVTATCVDTTLNDPEAGSWKIKCQDYASYGRQDGDSGAPVFIQEYSPHVGTIVGVHSGNTSGGTAIFSAVANIEHDLDMDLYFGPWFY